MKVERGNDPVDTEACWWWKASGLPTGYGLFSLKGQRYYAHRVSYSLFFGDPGPLVLDHKCDNGTRGCVRALHLDPVTAGENVLRSMTSVSALNARKTHCKRGHEFTADNTLWGTNPNGRPRRECRTCRRMLAAKYLAARTKGA